MSSLILGKCLKGDYPDGRDYRGKLDHTIDGITCQKWSSQYPHSHKLLPYPYEDTGKDDPDGLGECYNVYHQSELSHDARKPVFGVSDQVRHKPTCTVTEES